MRAAQRTPMRVAGTETARIWSREYWYPAAAMKPTMDTTATDTGEAEMPIWEAMEETAMGRSGRIFSLMEIS